MSRNMPGVVAKCHHPHSATLPASLEQVARNPSGQRYLHLKLTTGGKQGPGRQEGVACPRLLFSADAVGDGGARVLRRPVFLPSGPFPNCSYCLSGGFQQAGTGSPCLHSARCDYSSASPSWGSTHCRPTAGYLAEHGGSSKSSPTQPAYLGFITFITHPSGCRTWCCCQAF
jgi:hypothetical protein